MLGWGAEEDGPPLTGSSSPIAHLNRRHAMRGRLYYTAKAKKTGKVMIKIHPCSRLCFCRCFVCFKEVTGRGPDGRRGRALGLAPGPPGPVWVCPSVLALRSALPSLPTVPWLPVEQ